jgi:hypothetical protein
MKKYLWSVVAIAWIVFLTLPIGFFIAKGVPNRTRLAKWVVCGFRGILG